MLSAERCWWRPVFHYYAPSRRPVDLNVPCSRGLKVKFRYRFQREVPQQLCSCFTVVLCGFWVAPFFQAGARLILWSGSGLSGQGCPGHSVHAPVKLQVPGEVAKRDEALAADVAGEGPLCAMQQPVTLEVALVAEELATLQARERLFPGMD